MRCPKCDADQGEAAIIAARGYHCLSCDAWPQSAWWHRADFLREVPIVVGEMFDELRVRGRVDATVASVCFDAVHVTSGRIVDLRVYRPWVASPKRVVQFEHLLATTGPFCVPAVRGGRVGEGLFVATERGGRSLAESLGTRIEWPRACAIMVELCRAFSLAHAADIVLGFTPEHVFVTDEGRVRIDLFAHFAEDAVPNPEIDQRIARELRIEYVSPERLMGKPVDARSDVYTLGVVAYEMITGRRPFPDAKGPAGLITAMLRERPAPPRALVSTLPMPFDVAIMRCLERDRDARFGDVQAVADAFRDDDVS